MISGTYIKCPRCGNSIKVYPDLYRVRCEKCEFIFINPKHTLYLNPDAGKGGLYYEPDPKGALYKENPKGALWEPK